MPLCDYSEPISRAMSQREAVTAITDLFGDPRAEGSQMAARAVGALAPPDEVAGSCAALATDLLRAIDAARR